MGSLKMLEVVALTPNYSRPYTLHNVTGSGHVKYMMNSTAFYICGNPAHNFSFSL